MASHAKAHRERATAALSAQAGAAAATRYANGYELQLAKLAEDRRRLKAIQSIARKIEVKRELLPEYAPWVSGVLAGGQGAQDDVLMTVMLWRIDVGDFAGAIEIARYAIAHDLTMPDRYARSTACLLAEEVADTALKAIESKEAVAPPLLLETDELTAGQDMPDEVRAKLNKAIAYALLAQPDDDHTEGEVRLRKEVALARLQQALYLHDRVGVKKDIERLERELKNSAATSG